jgi:hypothetical protein
MHTAHIYKQKQYNFLDTEHLQEGFQSFYQNEAC